MTATEGVPVAHIAGAAAKPGSVASRQAPADLTLSFVDEATVRAVVAAAGEPEWLLAERLEGLRSFDALPIETNPLYTTYVDLRNAKLAATRPSLALPSASPRIASLSIYTGEAVRRGNTFVTNGLMLDFTVQGARPGEEVRRAVDAADRERLQELRADTRIQVQRPQQTESDGKVGGKTRRHKSPASQPHLASSSVGAQQQAHEEYQRCHGTRIDAVHKGGNQYARQGETLHVARQEPALRRRRPGC